MDPCEKIQNDLLDYLDTRMKENKAKTVSAHLADCATCQVEFQKLKEMRELIQQTKDSNPPPAYLDSKILKEARDFIEKPEIATFWDFLFRPWPVFTATMVLLVVISGVILREHSSLEQAIIEKGDSIRTHAPTERKTEISQEYSGDFQIHFDESNGTDSEKEQPEDKNKSPMNITFYKPEKPEQTRQEPFGRERNAATEKVKTARSLPPQVKPEPPDGSIMARNPGIKYLETTEAEAFDIDADMDLSLQTISQKTGSIRFVLAQGVSAPVITSQPPPVYPGALKENQIEGKVMIVGTVSPDGRLIDVSIKESSHSGFEQSVLDAVKNWRFRPGLRMDEPVAVPCTIYFVFSIES